MKRSVLFLIAIIVLLGAIGATQALAYHVYSAPCGQATGLVGLLQTLHFAPTANCDVVKTGACLNPGAICTIKNPVSGKVNAGKCVAGTAPNTGKPNCLCVPD